MRVSLSATKWIGGGLVALVAVGLFVHLNGFLTAASPSRDASATLLGFTNVTGKGRCAMFAITNTSRQHIELMVHSYEESASGGWKRQAVDPTWVSSFVGWKSTLSVGEGFVFHVVAPTTNAPWRIWFVAQERGAGEVLRDIVGPSKSKERFYGNQALSGRRYIFISPEVVQ